MDFYKQDKSSLNSNTCLHLFTGATRPAEVVPVQEGIFQATYLAVAEGKCKIDVKYGGSEVPGR